MATIQEKLALILTEKGQIKSVINDFLNTDPVLASGATPPEPIGVVFSNYSEKVSEIFTALNDSITEKIGYLDDIVTKVNNVYADTLTANGYANFDTVLSGMLTTLKAREEALDAAKTSLVTAVTAAADLEAITSPADADFDDAIRSAITSLQTIATNRKTLLTAARTSIGNYWTENSQENPVATDFSNLSTTIDGIVDALQASETKDSNLTSYLNAIATNINALVDDGIEEIPAALQLGEGESATEGKFENTAEGLAAYKASLKLEVVDGDTGNPVAVYSTYAGKIAVIKAQVEATELKIIDDIVAKINLEKYGVAAGHKFPTAQADYPSIPGKVSDALDDILAKGVSNNLQALKTAVASDKDAAGDAVIASDNEAGYIGKVHSAFQSWQTAADDFRTAVNVKIGEVNGVTSSFDATAIADDAAPNTFGTAVVAALGKYKDEIESLQGNVGDASDFKANIIGQINAENDSEHQLGENATDSAVKNGLSDLLAYLNKQANQILYGSDSEPAASEGGESSES